MEDFHVFYNKKNHDSNSILKKAKKKDKLFLEATDPTGVGCSSDLDSPCCFPWGGPWGPKVERSLFGVSFSLSLLLSSPPYTMKYFHLQQT